ncbi:hypothetical protein BMF94_0347, partial [Rhodotorula taiwanensis]
MNPFSHAQTSHLPSTHPTAATPS